MEDEAGSTYCELVVIQSDRRQHGDEDAVNDR